MESTGATNPQQDTRRTVYLALPRLGHPWADAAWAGYVVPHTGNLRVMVSTADNSLLAHNVNNMWCSFVNGVAGFPAFDYFAVLHADVAPVGLWLDDMVRLLAESPHAVLHAACRIKDDRGVTSTAVGPVDDPYFPVRKLALPELQALPPTFGYREVQQSLGTPEEWCLLPNTGCLLVDRRRFPCRSFPGFTITDELDWALADDGTFKRVAKVAPEDWNFGRWCARNRVSVGGTRAVVTRHLGYREYRSDDPPGRWLTDEHHRNTVGKALLAGGLITPQELESAVAPIPTTTPDGGSPTTYLTAPAEHFMGAAI